MTIDELLGADPQLVDLRRELAANSRGRRGDRLRQEIEKQEASLRAQWEHGLVGWLTEEEGRALAVTLTAEARAAGIGAEATIDTSGKHARVVFRGARASGTHTHDGLTLCSSSPVRVRSHWECWLMFCPALDHNTVTVLQEQARRDAVEAHGMTELELTDADYANIAVVTCGILPSSNRSALALGVYNAALREALRDR